MYGSALYTFMNVLRCLFRGHRYEQMCRGFFPDTPTLYKCRRCGYFKTGD